MKHIKEQPEEYCTVPRKTGVLPSLPRMGEVRNKNAVKYLHPSPMSAERCHVKQNGLRPLRSKKIKTHKQKTLTSDPKKLKSRKETGGVSSLSITISKWR
jgi:hypothetical protein